MTQARLWFADNLRILLTALVVVHHVAVTYSGMPLWYYTEDPHNGAVSLGLSVFLLVNQAWFMGAFFLLSGCFTPGAHARKGPRAFLRDRFVRLGIPLVAFYFVLNPILCIGRYHGTSPLDFYLHTIGSGPLWFVFALLVLDLCYAAFRHLTRNRPQTARPLTYRAVAGFVVGLALVTYALRVVVPLGTWVPVIDFPTSAYLPQYVSFFIAGTVARRLTAVPAGLGKAGLGMALGATVVFLPLALAAGGDAWLGHGTPSSLWYALWDSTFAVGVVLALLTFFRRRCNTTGPVRQYLAGHAYTVYVIHAFLVTAAGHALSSAPLPALVKFAIVATVVLCASFLLADPIRRIPGVRRAL